MDSSDVSDQKSCSSCGSCWQFPALLGLVLAAILLTRSCGLRDGEESVVNSPPHADGKTVASGTVSLVIDSGDGQPLRFDGVAWHEAMTIEDLLATVSQMPNSPEIAKRGSGTAAFLTRIGDVANEGAEGRNWTYQVNDRRGDRSFAVYELAPGDRVLWKFGPQE